MSTAKDREPAQPKDQDQNIRRLSLVAYLLSRNGHPVGVGQVRRNVEGYTDASMTDVAFKRRFSEDRAELAELGVRVLSDGGDDNSAVYWLPTDTYYLPRVLLSAEELAALAACLVVLEGRFAYSQPLRLALLSLALGNPEILAEAEAESPPLTIIPETSEPPALLPKLQAAIDDRKTVVFTYYTIGRDQELERTVDPYGLQLVSGEWYLIGRCHLRDAVRTFRLSRIRSRVTHATRRPHDFAPPDDFQLSAYKDRPAWRLAAVRGTATVRVDASMAWWVEAHWGHCGTVETQADGGIVYTTDYADERRLLSWVLGLADAAVLVAPAELRARLLDELTAVTAALDEPPPDTTDAGPAGPPQTPASPRRRRREPDDWRVEVDRFTRINTVAAYLLTACGEDEAVLDVAQVCAALGVTAAQLREDVGVLNVVGFVGGGSVMYATFKGRKSLHVQCDLEGDTLARPARLSPLQADTLLLAISLVGGQVPGASGSALRSAEQKIRAARGTHPTVDTSELLPLDDEVLDKVSTAIAQHRLLRIEYWKEGTDTRSERTVEPYFLRHERGEFFYVCWCHSARDVRVFRVATTRSAELLDETFAPRDDVQLDLYRREGIPTTASYAPRTATVWYSDVVARWVEERQPVLHLPDGSCLAEQPYVDAGWLAHFVLRFAGQARLLGPPEAVEHLRATAGRMLAAYD